MDIVDTEVPKQGVLFDDRFLDRYAGPIISDTAVAIVELVANAWDAYATRVDIVWPKRTEKIAFTIKDNGKGVNVHSKVTRCDHVKLTHPESGKAHRRAAPK